MKSATPLQNSQATRTVAGVFSRWGGVLIVALTLAASTHVGGAEISVAKEYQLKAAFLYNFTKFADWPAHCFSGTNSPIVLGILGRNPFGTELEKTITDRKVNGRSIVVRPVNNAREALETHVLFVSGAEDNRLEELAQAISGAPILTVGESEMFARRNGIINFFIESDKLRFDINMDAADRAGLKISAQLQKLAKTVRRKP